MNHKQSRKASPANANVRCAIYTRKSTQEGLSQQFNSLDAQRESGEAFIKSQQHEGWECLPDSYDDGGFTGGNMDRPALKRLLSDIEAGRIDCVVVYKVDRLSRSLLDFARMMETFEKNHVSFVSVTQQFNTATSMGRLVLNVLLSFAQFEREIISERTRDKIAAARRTGKWSGGMPLLGYDVSSRGSKLLVNEDEAVRVRAIFELYLEYQSLIRVVQELERRGWTNKRWVTRHGQERGGKPFSKTSLHKLLTNVTYTGHIKYKDEVHNGEHSAIVDLAVWQRVQAMLQRNAHSGGPLNRNRFGALLKGLLCCAPCGCAMSPTHSTKNGSKRYRYYVCTGAQKRGWSTCLSKSIPAAEIEQFVVTRIKGIGQDPKLQAETFAQAREQVVAQLTALETEQRGLEREMARWNAEVCKLLDHIRPGDSNTPALARLADLQERIRTGERRATQVRDEIISLNRGLVDARQVAQALADFDPLWETLSPREQAQVLQLLVERVEYNGAMGKVAITFHPAGIKVLAEKTVAAGKEKIA
jgi:site-specific DNA recombinase